MRKKLSEMTLEELWQLFPIFLTEHKEYWGEWYEEERRFLTDLLPDGVIINHIGSTAIKGIWAKPIIDILVEVPDVSFLGIIRDILSGSGYNCMWEEEDRIFLNKGYTEEGFAERVFHIHVRMAGDNAEIAFRDYMNANPKAAADYERLKLSLWKKYEHNRDGYTEAKTDFIKQITFLMEKDSMKKELQYVTSDR